MQHSDESVEEWRIVEGFENYEVSNIEEFDSTYDAQAKLGISNSNICACLKGRRRMAGGFLWRYK